MTIAAIKSRTPGEGAPDPDTGGESTAWDMRRKLPSEHAHRFALRWPGHVSDLTDIPEPTLKKMRADGDHPRLYAIGRSLFTTQADLAAWFKAHEIDPGQIVRPATVPKGTKLAKRQAAAEGTAP